MNMSLQRFPGFRMITILCLIVLYAPVLVMAVYSFNSERSISHWGGFSLSWYLKALHNPAIQSAALNSILIAVTAAGLASVMATTAALALHHRKQFRGRAAVQAIINLPLMIPEIITAVASLVFFLAIGLSPGLLTILIAHTVFCIPFAYLPVSARLKNMDQRLNEAAADLYASPWLCFRRITLPLLLPGIASGFMLAFIVSLDDFIVANMVAGPGATTLPLAIYSMVRVGFTPEINAISTLLLLISTLLVLTQWFFNRRQTPLS